MTFYLKLPAGARKDQAAALKKAHRDLVRLNEDGEDVLGSIYTPRLALHYDDQTPAGAFIMVNFFDGQSLGPLPPGLVKKWEAGGAPVKWAGD